MPSVNKTILIGNLTRDPQTRILPTQLMVADFGMAMSRKYKDGNGEDREDVCFVDLTAFGRQAEAIAKYCKKGKLLYVEGRLRYDTWEDKNGGGKRSKLSVVVENFQFIGGPPQDQGDYAPAKPSVKNYDGMRPPARGEKPPPEPPFGDALEFKEADIPF